MVEHFKPKRVPVEDPYLPSIDDRPAGYLQCLQAQIDELTKQVDLLNRKIEAWGLAPQ